jgi:hypothetical protein
MVGSPSSVALVSLLRKKKIGTSELSIVESQQEVRFLSTTFYSSGAHQDAYVHGATMTRPNSHT